MTDVLEAIFSCDLKKLKIMLPDQEKVNLEIPWTEGCTPLHLVVGTENVCGKDQVLSYLLELGADPNSRSYDDLTPVHIASMWNNCSELEKLLQNGGNPWLTDNQNKNSFDLAINNHAYEAYQLLNKYLSEDKLNFRCCLSRNINYCQESTDNNGVMNGDNVNNTTFFSTNENFPLYFSSTDDESGDFFLNVSKILKKDLIKNPETEQKNFTRANVLEKISTNKEFNLSSDGYTSCTDYQKTVPKTIYKTETCSTSDETEMYSTSENEYVITDEAETDETETDETIVDLDNKSGIALVEKSCSSMDFSSVQRCNISDCSNHIANDWKTCQSQNTSCSSESCSSHSTILRVPSDYRKFSNSRIYLELKNMGDDPGPVSDATREVYLRRLTRFKNGCNTSCILPKPKYCPEMYRFLEGKANTDRIQNMMNIMAEEFDSLDPNEKWREGNQRCCFNYFLLDPRVTQNLPSRLKQLTFEKAFLTFVDALFYVGKGMRGRPYSHLLEAIKTATNMRLKNDKVSHILDIWDSGFGVISLHCFNNCIPVEAYTQEACIIEALGLENLTNIKTGDCYGAARKWKRSWKRQVGVELLHRALQIFILEGEKQIMPKDIKTR